ncbi:serine/threonine-protein kinase [Nonomuraea sp. NPDC049637]|uniref:serine/threonine-protein kinase n=1 Tax=Nonomuraea sp. NPDC049637 TaxID=3154356 RepID=UPI00341E6080
MSDATPSMVADRYRLDELIGSGPMGEVWRAYDTRADWVVAVKILGAGAAGEAAREALKQHAQAVARVIHPNVAMVLDVGDQEGAPFLVTEFLTGTSVGEDLAAEGPMPIVEVCDLVGQAAAGLDAAHRAGVFHGQIDSGSFRRAASGVLKVVGFGLPDEEPSQAERRYLAPERASGRPATAAADLYALGAVCYELLCGRPPVATPDLPVTGMRATPPSPPAAPGTAAPGTAAPGTPAQGSPAQGSPAPGTPASGTEAPGGAGQGIVPPSAIRPEIPAELDRLVLAMLAPDPARRPSGGEPVRRALAAIARPGAAPGAAPNTGANSGANTGVNTAPNLAGAAAGRPGDTRVYDFNGVPRAGDTAVYESAGLDQAPPRTGNKLLVQMGIAVAVIAVVAVAMVVWAGSRKETPVAEPSASAPPTSVLSPDVTLTAGPTSEPPEASPTDLTPGDTATSLVQTVGPKATLGPRQTPAGGWDHWLVKFDEAVTAQEDIGDINPHVAEKVHDKLRKAAKKLQDGHFEPARGQIAGVYRDLRKAQVKGDVPLSGPLASFLDDFALS